MTLFRMSCAHSTHAAARRQTRPDGCDLETPVAVESDRRRRRRTPRNGDAGMQGAPQGSLDAIGCADVPAVRRDNLNNPRKPRSRKSMTVAHTCSAPPTWLGACATGPDVGTASAKASHYTCQLSGGSPKAKWPAGTGAAHASRQMLPMHVHVLACVLRTAPVAMHWQQFPVAASASMRKPSL